LLHTPLKRARLPIPPPRPVSHLGYYSATLGIGQGAN